MSNRILHDEDKIAKINVRSDSTSRYIVDFQYFTEFSKMGSLQIYYYKSNIETATFTYPPAFGLTTNTLDLNDHTNKTPYQKRFT